MILPNVAGACSATRYRNALLSAHAAAILFGLTGLLGALINQSATTITLGRALFAVLALGAVSLLQRRNLWRGMTAQRLLVLAVSGALLCSHWVSFFIAVKLGGVAIATLGFASFPAFIALIDWLVFREKLNRMESLLVLMVSAGLVLVAPSFDFADKGTIGLIWGLGSGLSFALLAVTNRRYAKGMGALQVAFWQNLIVALLVLPFAIHGLAHKGLSPSDWTYLALLGVLCTGLSQYLFVKSLEQLPARSAGMIIALEPVYAIACAWIVFGEEPAIRMLTGATLIIMATIASARRKSVESSAH